MNLNENIDRIRQVMGLNENNIDIEKEIARRKRILDNMRTKRSEISSWMIKDGSYVIRKGDYNSAVRELQYDLMQLKYNVGPKGMDGHFGPDTEVAVKKFQQDNNLTVDGIVGKKTFDMLDKLMKPIYDAEALERKRNIDKSFEPKDDETKNQ